MVWIVCSQGYGSSVWGTEISEGLKKELRKKRIRFCFACNCSSVCQGDGVFLIGSDAVWFNRTTAVCNKVSVTPIILCSVKSRKLSGRFHCVYSNIIESVRRLCDTLKSGGKTAVYGVNPSSSTDTGICDCISSSDCDADIYYNNGSLARCFEGFLPNVQNTDTVICTNDFAAVSLVKNLELHAPEVLERLSIISCNITVLSSYFSRYIKSVDTNLDILGKAAVSVFELAQKNCFISGISVSVDREGTMQPVPVPTAEPTDRSGGFYDDDELRHMMTVANLLNSCDKTDLSIIRLILDDKKYDEICDETFLSKSTLMYRIKRYFDVCSLSSKTELCNYLAPYIK